MQQIGLAAFSGHQVQKLASADGNAQWKREYTYKTDAGDLTMAQILAIAKSRGVSVLADTIRKRLSKRYMSPLDYLFAPPSSGRMTPLRVAAAEKNKKRREAGRIIRAEKAQWAAKMRSSHNPDRVL